MRWLSILVLALALVAAGCGGGDDDSSASDTTTIEETTDTTRRTMTTTDDGTDTDRRLRLRRRGLPRARRGLPRRQPGVRSCCGRVHDELEEQAEAFAEFADDVPEEIRPTSRRSPPPTAQYVEVLQDAGIEPGEIPTAEQAQELRSARVRRNRGRHRRLRAPQHLDDRELRRPSRRG